MTSLPGLSIIGAGMAGLLAANMLPHHRPVVYEKQKELPNNHTAVLRFRTSIVGDVLGIEFKKVTMIKDVIGWLNPVADAMAYADKNGGRLRSDRSVIAGRVEAERYIAPPDLIARMADRVEVMYDWDFVGSLGNTVLGKSVGPCISTVPMPTLMRLLEYPITPEELGFTYRDGVNISARVTDCDAYVSLYFPSPRIAFSRVSITGDNLIIEGDKTLTLPQGIDGAAQYLGIKRSRVFDPVLHEQRYSKINPINDRARKAFMFWATTEHNIYSLGRYATWRPGLLLDDLVNDVRVIDRFIRSGDRYALKQHSEK